MRPMNVTTHGDEQTAVEPMEQEVAAFDGGLGTEAESLAAALRKKVERLRKISNVVQALENVLTQSEGLPEFADLRMTADRELASARRLLTMDIHS